MAIDHLDPRESEANKMRVAKLKKLGMLEGISFEELDPLSEYRRQTEDLREFAEDPTYDKRPGLKKILSCAQEWSKRPNHSEGGYWTGTLEDIVSEVLRVCANDLDGSVDLPPAYKNQDTTAAGYVFEIYRGWTVEDFQSLFTALDHNGALLDPIPNLDFETLRRDSLTKQENIEYNEERDLAIIEKINPPLLYRGYAFERLFKKLKAEPGYMEKIREKFAPIPLQIMDTYPLKNYADAARMLKRANEFTTQINMYNERILKFIEEKTAE